MEDLGRQVLNNWIDAVIKKLDKITDDGTALRKEVIELRAIVSSIVGQLSEHDECQAVILTLNRIVNTEIPKDLTVMQKEIDEIKQILTRLEKDNERHTLLLTQQTTNMKDAKKSIEKYNSFGDHILKYILVIAIVGGLLAFLFFDKVK